MTLFVLGLEHIECCKDLRVWTICSISPKKQGFLVIERPPTNIPLCHIKRHNSFKHTAPKSHEILIVCVQEDVKQ